MNSILNPIILYREGISLSNITSIAYSISYLIYASTI